MQYFSRYGDQAYNSIAFDELLKMQAAENLLWARAEQSGSEGCYCEVARWNEGARRWERFAFAKFFGGENLEQPDASSIETAKHFADQINALDALHGLASIIHRMPNYSGEPAKVGAA